MLASSGNLHEQRSYGRVSIGVERAGLQVMREAGSAKIRFPHGGKQAILINTGGGLAGGDDFAFDVRLGPGATLSLTTQAAERVYRTLGPAARVLTTLKVDANGVLHWLPNECILFDGSALSRELHVELGANARFLATESVVFGRTEMGETIGRVQFHDRWRICREDKLIFADDVTLSGALPRSRATLNGAGAIATLVFVGPGAETLLDGVRQAIGDHGGASAWNGKLVARIIAKDGFELRKVLIPALCAVAGVAALPKIWTF